MATQAETIRANINANRSHDLQSQLHDYGSQPVEEVANGIPVSNDAALAASLKELRDGSQEYARLRTEADRQQFEAIAADNIRKTQSAAAEATDKASIETMNRTLREREDGLRALSEWEAVAQSIDPAKKETEWTLPLDKLKDIAVTQQKVINTTGMDPLNFNPMDAPVQTKIKNGREYLAPVPFPDGKLYHVENLPDGQVKLNLSTGETFTGDNMETLLAKVSEAKVQTTVWARQKAAQAQQTQQPPSQPVENLGQEFTPSGSLADDLAARQRESVARSFGFSSADEMIQDYQSNKQLAKEAQAFSAEAKMDRALTTFSTQHPDFPGTDEANDALGRIFDERGWEVTAENLELAHSLAVQRRMYEPLGAEAIAVAYGQAPARRASAPPMLRTNNPEITNAAPDPYNMPLADLRQQAIAQELTRGGQNYR
jgi:hypothetical protein